MMMMCGSEAVVQVAACTEYEVAGQSHLLDEAALGLGGGAGA